MFCRDCKYLIKDEILNRYVCTNYDSDFSDEYIGGNIKENCDEFDKKDIVILNMKVGD